MIRRMLAIDLLGLLVGIGLSQCRSSAQLQCPPPASPAPVVLTNGCQRAHSDGFWQCVGEAGAAP